MSTVIPREGGGYTLFTKGASEIVLKKCTFILGNDGQPQRFTPADQESMVNSVIEPMACDGLRTICVAFKNYVPGKSHAQNLKPFGEFKGNIKIKAV